MIKRQNIKGKRGQTSTEYLLFIGFALLFGLMLHHISTPLVSAMFYGDQAEPSTGGSKIASNAGLEMTMARPFP